MKKVITAIVLALALSACTTPQMLYKQYRAEGMSHSEAMDMVGMEVQARCRWNGTCRSYSPY